MSERDYAGMARELVKKWHKQDDPSDLYLGSHIKQALELVAHERDEEIERLRKLNDLNCYDPSEIKSLMTERANLRLRLERMESWVALYLNNAKYWPIEIPGDGGRFDKVAFYKDFCKALEGDLDE